MVEVIKKTFMEVLPDVWPMLIIITVIISSLRITYLITKHKKFLLHKEIIYLLAVIYLLCLFHVVTFQDINYGTSNFIPFKEIFRYSFNSKLFYRNVIGNVAIFVPFGYYSNYYCKSKNITYSLLITLIVSTTIETIQLALGRSFDIDDIILNVLGGVVGYLLYIFSEFIFKKTSEKVKNSFLLNLICVLIIIILLVIILSLYGVVI